MVLEESVGRAGSDGGSMMDATIPVLGDAVGEIWPALPYEVWKDSPDTLHM
jgi:hypothetical protein